MFLYKVDEQLSLKLMEVDDAEQLFELIEKSHDYLRQWLPWLDLTTTLEDTRLFIQAAKMDSAEGKSLNAAIVWNGKIVGMAGFSSIDQIKRIAKIGYWLAPEFQGSGMMTTVVKALTDYAFAGMSLDKVEIRVATENAKSRAIPVRLGYTEEATLPHAEWLYDHYVDHVVYTMRAEEWNQ
ncbi:GNAT family N-acetyltransferase [Planococcus salinus]|uniref:N-acetyltransferase n=1 Tax=Planococcus salinus TaxID=1848460 RepID=A0A3M8P5F6_9BACL|nr:GNAT family protein [Planococcus salinus]RNF38909.1 N-acetyltransferase [Planococcus salinus]